MGILYCTKTKYRCKYFNQEPRFGMNGSTGVLPRFPKVSEGTGAQFGSALVTPLVIHHTHVWVAVIAYQLTGYQSACLPHVM